MKTVLSFLTLFILSTLSAVFCDANTNKDNNVLFLNVIQVEGLKTPSNIYPTAGFVMPLWPEGLSQLTNVGKRDQFEVGKWLRARYPELIHFYYEDSLYVLSSDFDSAIMSAETLLAGMYIPEGKEVWGPLHWQPMPVHTIPSNHDNLIAMTASCYKYKMEKNSFQYFEEVFNIDVAYSGLFAYLTENAGARIYSVDKVRELYEYIIIQEKMNNSLKGIPKWAEDVLTSMRNASVTSLTLSTYTNNMKIYRSGPLITLLMGSTLEKYYKLKTGFELDDDATSLRIYSVHVDTMASLLNTLGIFNEIVPPYSSTLLWEMTKTLEGKYVVKLMYKNSSDEPYSLTLPGCTEFCSVEKMELLLSKYFDSVNCSLNDPSTSKPSTLSFLQKIGIAVFTLVAVLCLILLVYFFIKQPQFTIYQQLKPPVE